MKIKIHPKLLNFIYSRIDDELETAFYLIGFALADEILVADAIEFSYQERSSFFVKSNPFQFGLLSLATISQLKIVSILHTHPFTQGKPSPSGIDLEDLNMREDIPFLIMSGDFNITCVFSGNHCDIEEEEFTFSSLEVDNEIVYFLENIPTSIPLAEEKYKTYLLSKIVGNNVIKPLFFDVVLDNHPFKVKYRIRIQQSRVKSIKDILWYVFGNELNGKKIYLDGKELSIDIIQREIESGRSIFSLRIGE